MDFICCKVPLITSASRYLYSNWKSSCFHLCKCCCLAQSTASQSATGTSTADYLLKTWAPGATEFDAEVAVSWLSFQARLLSIRILITVVASPCGPPPY